MEHILENKFLNKEGMQKKFLNEEEDELKAVTKQKVYATSQQAEFQIYESFIKEKSSLLSYVQELVIFSAKKHEVDNNYLYPGDKVDGTRIKNEQDLLDVKNRIIIILEKYQEQAGVLDPILEQVVGPIMRFMQVFIKKGTSTNQYAIPKDVSNLFEIIHYICKVRGFKTVVKFFPHEVADMEPVVEMFHFQETEEWWIAYVLILWLSIIVLVPFDIDTIDSKKEVEILVKRIINICKTHMANSGKIREATAVLLSKLLTRPDVIRSGETDFFLGYLAVEYQQTKDDANQMFLVSGILQTLTETFKVGHREDLLKRIDTVFDPILKTEVKNKFMAKSTNLRMFKVKLAQRIGCIFLKPKVAKWRYQRGFRSLLENLQSQQQLQQTQEFKANKEEDVEMEDDEEINWEQLEHIIQFLLESLKDEDSVVRWNAAKGIGRITGRMNKDFADQIVEQLFTLFGANETENSWHGGCLALAELCRRGLLLPERLESFVPQLEQALIYDINIGNHSVGAHVRDAACYVVWSFARAYAPEIMKPHVHALSTQLIVESLFDREVNCRRAASATFQECVGRQGTFPHGIEILTQADYFTLSNRVNAFLNVSCFVAQFPEYFDRIVDHLAFIKLRHWEPQIRELAAQALSVVCAFNPKYITEKILPQLVNLCLDKALHIRHGAILGVGEILIGLSGNSWINRREVLEKAKQSLSMKERKLIEENEHHGFLETYNELSRRDQLDQGLGEGSSLRTDVKQIIDKVDKQRLYRGKGGEIMRAGVCHLIFSLSKARIPLSEAERVYLFKTLQENFKHPNIEIQEEATKAFRSFGDTYLSPAEYQELANTDKQIVSGIHSMFKPSSVDDNIAITRGYNMAFGALSKQMIQNLTPDVFDTLIKNCIPKGREADDAETRRMAVKSLIHVVKTYGLVDIDRSIVNDLMTTLYQCMNDYQIDRRGDVGSWVREEAMAALTQISRMISESQDPTLVTYLKADVPQFYERFIQTLLQQLSEKIDKVREVAGRCLQEFFKHVAPAVVEFAERDKLVALFVQDQEKMSDVTLFTENSQEGLAYLPWRSAEFVFQQLRHFFDSDVYSQAILKGLITSSGGLTESTLKASSNQLFEYLSEMGKDKVNGLQSKKNFMKKLINIYQENLRDERVTVPMMKTIEMLLSSDYLSEEGLIDELKHIHHLTVQECQKSKNIVKLMSSAGVFAGMLVYQDKDLLLKAVKSLLFLLYHSFPKVRKLTSEKLYTALLTMEDYSLIVPGGEDEYDAAMAQISETNWSEPLKEISGGKEKMYAFFGLQTQKAQKAVEDEQKSNMVIT